MGQLSAIEQLPDAVRREFDGEVVRHKFADLDGLVAWLGARGYEIGRSSVGRYTQNLKQLNKVRRSMELAMLVENELGDQQNLLGSSSARIVQAHAFGMLSDEKLEGLELSEQVKIVAPLGRMLADLNRSQIAQQKYQEEVRRRVEAAAEAVSEQIKASGLSQAAADQITAKILGIAHA